jgi:glutaconate CoA-transferase, subunit A
MADKTTTVDEIVSELSSGMTIGIGGWGSRRKPMAVVRAICRSGLENLTIVAYGGPDVGLLCATGKATKVVCAFVTLDSTPLDPHWRAARQAGRVELSEIDEGMFFLGLQAASWRVPFLPARAGLGSDVPRNNPDLRTVRSPYGTGSPYLHHPDDADVELTAVPALHLDAAIIHTNSADTAGNAQILSPDPFFDDLFLGAADKRFVTAERIVENGTLSELGPLSSIAIHRLQTDGVAASPGGAHFTANPPDYGRDESFQKEYAASAKDPDDWATFRARYVDVPEDDYQAAVTARRESEVAK